MSVTRVLGPGSAGNVVSFGEIVEPRTLRYWVRCDSRAALLSDDEVVVGRSPYCTLVIDDGSVSRLHARLRLIGDRVVLEDAQSRNGTFVNERAITKPTVVTKDDRIRLGQVPVVLELAPVRRTLDTGKATESETLAEGAGQK